MALPIRVSTLIPRSTLTSIPLFTLAYACVCSSFTRLQKFHQFLWFCFDVNGCATCYHLNSSSMPAPPNFFLMDHFKWFTSSLCSHICTVLLLLELCQQYLFTCLKTFLQLHYFFVILDAAVMPLNIVDTALRPTMSQRGLKLLHRC